ncbi:response regulator [Stenotrophomonas sp. GD03701]|uniref:Response regulator n=4 Tax=Stenotrophomonas maltophilia TaxID=40324 RepID=A0AAW3S516_STEMA|nr:MULTISPECIES: response regulator [Stenotrophomonas]QCZ96565.1 response regulator [Stenotrophomonas sp. pho]MBA0311547.1 response regulator [Stenotrophomonas maltophilia]MBH1825956.1 response regulator [Stenotrophomonas maltophilia]MBN5061770.1 response regulator [Stenotrophomonas maltophilia]MBN5086684.1 response regulator [Stenotrophomonas maltophilia]
MGLDGKAVRVLLVEDEPTLMMVLEQAIAQVGYDVSKTAEDLPTALACAEEAAFDVAVLDVNLNGVESYPVADRLVELGVPFLFTTGLGANRLPDRFKGTPFLEKPFRLKEIAAALQSLRQELEVH